jgi:polysaccharide export outer membrane protein
MIAHLNLATSEESATLQDSMDDRYLNWFLSLIVFLVLFASGSPQIWAQSTGAPATDSPQASANQQATRGTQRPCSEAEVGELCRKDESSDSAGGVTISNMPGSNMPGPSQNSTAPSPSLPNDNPALPVKDSAAQEKPQPPEKPQQGESQRRQPYEPTGRNAFQDFVAGSVGYRLPIFGYNLFLNVPSTFAPNDHSPVTADYVIGPGDELLIRAWGQLDVNYRAVVDRSGQIFIPKVGGLQVAGLRFADLQGYLRSAIGRVFRNFDLNVTLGQLRSIQVLVVGQALRPGTYTVSSLSTLVNALFASGGPSLSGSMRHIQLKRSNRVVTDFDLYDLLLKGDRSQDVQLQPGDVIFIPPIGKLAAVAGSVDVPGIYEIKDGTQIKDLLGFAGGLNPTALGQKLTIERIADHSVRKVEEVVLDPGGLSRTVEDGDLVRIFPISGKFENAVTIRGNVAMPGRFPWHEGMRVNDLIPSRESLITPEYWRRQNSITFTNLNGAGINANGLGSQEQLRVEVKRNTAEINWDYAVVERLNLENLTSSLIPFNLGKAIEDDPQEDVLLKPGDVITIFSQTDLAVPVEKRSKYVRLEGEFQHAGVYKIESAETLRHLVLRLGGFTPNAYLFGAQFLRESTRIEQQQKLDELLDKLSLEVERSASRKSQNLTTPEEAVALTPQIESQRRLVQNLRAIKATGRIVLEISPNATNAKELPDLALEDGDKLFVPYVPATVSVLGAVYNQTDLVFRKGFRTPEYLSKAGGLTRDADASRVYIIRADGSVLGKQRGSSWLTAGFQNQRLMPGDTIVAPERLDKAGFTKNLKDYTQILSQFALTAAAIHVLGL